MCISVHVWTFTAHRRRSTDLHNDISDPPPPRTPCILLRVACVRRGGRRCPVVLPPSAAITSGGGARRPPVEFSHVSPSWAAAVRSRVSRVHSSGVLIRAPAALPHAIPRLQCVDRSNIRCSPHRLYNIIIKIFNTRTAPIESCVPIHNNYRRLVCWANYWGLFFHLFFFHIAWSHGGFRVKWFRPSSLWLQFSDCTLYYPLMT